MRLMGAAGTGALIELEYDPELEGVPATEEAAREAAREPEPEIEIEWEMEMEVVMDKDA